MFMTSFVPFVVVFTNAVSARDAEDAALLGTVVGVLQAMKNSSNELGRLYSACTFLASYAASQVETALPGQEKSMEDQSLLDFADAAMVDAEVLRELLQVEDITRWDDLIEAGFLKNDFS